MNLEEIWKWLKGKRNTFFAEAATAFVLIAVLGVAGITAGRSGIAKSSEVESVRAKAEANKVEEQEQENAEKKQETQTEEVIADGQYPIMGQSSVTTEQMVSYFQSSGKAYPAESLAKGGADSIETFCRIYVEEAQAEGVRPEVAFVQTMKETGFLQYGGDASIEQFNFAGLGTTGGGVPGNSYPDVRTGVRAQIQHLRPMRQQILWHRNVWMTGMNMCRKARLRMCSGLVRRKTRKGRDGRPQKITDIRSWR